MVRCCCPTTTTGLSITSLTGHGGRLAWAIRRGNYAELRQSRGLSCGPPGRRAPGLCCRYGREAGAVPCLPRRPRAIRTRERALARGANRALYGDPAGHVPREDAGIGSDERDGQGVDRP